MGEVRKLLVRMTDCLQKSELNYVLVGGLAAIIRGRPRTTMDVDIIVENAPSKIDKFIKYLKEQQFDVMDEQVSMALKERSNVSIFDKESILRIDLKTSNTNDEKRVLNNAILDKYQNVKIRIASIEEILYGKICYMGDISDLADEELMNYNDIVDFVTVFQNAENIDMEWLEKEISNKKLTETLKRLLELIKNLD